jgi:hypothetical protein
MRRAPKSLNQLKTRSTAARLDCGFRVERCIRLIALRLRWTFRPHRE